ncbi:MAG: orotate phosphoribosyltransferase [Acidobacteria bacterium]|nr:MAG: orotate phosphoribosyltransferase [Acidobacteriota bacterium]
MDKIRQRLLELFKQKSLLIGRFTLQSGMSSNYYFDSKRTTLDPEGAYLSARLVLDKIKELGIKADAIGGLTLGADPIVSAVAAVSFSERKKYRPLPAFIVRKDAKQHGTQRYTEGYYGMPGSRVIIVDDVCTTGESTMKAIERAEQVGFVVTAVLCLIDREQGGAERLKRYNFIPLITSRELLSDPKIQEALEQSGDIERT